MYSEQGSSTTFPLRHYWYYKIWLFLLVNKWFKWHDIKMMNPFNVNPFTGSGLKPRMAALRRFLQKLHYSLKISWYRTTIQCKPIKCIYFLEVCIFSYQMILFFWIHAPSIQVNQVWTSENLEFFRITSIKIKEYLLFLEYSISVYIMMFIGLCWT